MVEFFKWYEGFNRAKVIEKLTGMVIRTEQKVMGSHLVTLEERIASQIMWWMNEIDSVICVCVESGLLKVLRELHFRV